ncbi:MAG: hypothetical protein SVU32_05665 [Candidatus Nanohaloarchaea archaeon]|nr:hypothetical protein [Candidatus Nanohaloarchaea archaeon]
MAVFGQLIENLRQVGFFRYFLPFLLMLAVTYGALNKIELFDDESVHGAISVVVALMTIVGVQQFVPRQYFSMFFGGLTLAILALLGLVMLLGMMGIDVQDVTFPEDKDKPLNRYVLLAFVLLIVVILGVFYGIPSPEGFQGIATSDTLYTFVMLGILIYVIYKVMQPNSGGDN